MTLGPLIKKMRGRRAKIENVIAAGMEIERCSILLLHGNRWWKQKENFSINVVAAMWLVIQRDDSIGRY